MGSMGASQQREAASSTIRLQKANKSDGQWSTWASDVRQSQPDQWSSTSSRWQSSAGDDRSWKGVSDWEGSKWSTPTRGTLVGSEYDSDQEWHLRSMRYGNGWAYDSTQSHYKRAKPTHQRPTTQERLAISGRERTVAKDGYIHPHHQDIGDQD